MSTKKKIAFKGEIVGEPSIWTSQSGTACCKFSVRTKDGLYECIAFHEKANIEGLAAGKQVSIRGSYKDQDAFEGKSVTIDVAIVEGGALTIKDSIIAEHGSMDNYKDYLLETAKHKRSLGFVLARTMIQLKNGEYKVHKAWYHAERCARHPISGETWLAIDLCMNILGAGEVTKRLKERGVALTIGSDNTKKYRDCVDEMLMEVGDKALEEAPF